MSQFRNIAKQVCTMFWYTTLPLFATFCFAGATLDINFKNYEMCKEHQDTPMQYWTTFTKINSTVSLANGKAVLPYPLGDDVRLDSTIEIFREDGWKELYTLKNKPLCQLLEKYGGELWLDAEQKLNMNKGCPIPKGTYELKDFVVDFSLLPIKTGPTALLRSTSTLKREDELLLCFYSEFELL